LNHAALRLLCGGFSTKIHVAVNGLGLPVTVQVTPGQAVDVTQPKLAWRSTRALVVIADNDHDSKQLVELIAHRGAQAVIRPRSNVKEPRAYDLQLYKERNLVKRFINHQIKQFRRVAMRYEKMARNFLASVQVAAIVMLL
jgi:transposase